jgi:hypothetical protein
MVCNKMIELTGKPRLSLADRAGFSFCTFCYNTTKIKAQNGNP